VKAGAQGLELFAQPFGLARIAHHLELDVIRPQHPRNLSLDLGADGIHGSDLDGRNLDLRLERPRHRWLDRTLLAWRTSGVNPDQPSKANPEHEQRLDRVRPRLHLREV
jgi:hypothetical protein